MKKITILLFGCIVFYTASSQQKISKEQFLNLNENQKRLYLKIMESDSLKTLRINQYLNNHPNSKRVMIKSRNQNEDVYVLTNIIDGKPIYRSTDNTNAALATGTNHLQIGGSLGLDLDGAGITVYVWDGGAIQNSHAEFQNETGSASRALNVEATHTDGSNNLSAHATHVSGTISARGANPSAKGMATGVNIRTYNFNNDTPEMANALSNPAAPLLFLSNHSYGVPVRGSDNVLLDSWIMGAYTQDANEIDDISRTYPKYLIVASAGNSGTTNYSGGLYPSFDKLTTDKTAKNNLVVANADPFVNPSTGELSFVINPSSSRGPTDDLRIKPDIAADGTNLLSSVPNDGYSSFTGTSMAAPNTTGSLALLQQYYDQLHGDYMNSSTLKGLVCHTATDDINVLGPDPTFGWGFLNAKLSAETITKANNNQAVLEELTLENGQTYTYTFSALAGDNIRATISWTDMPGAAVASGDANNPDPRLVNDLDLRITKDGIIYLPWKLDYSSSSGFSNSKDDNIVDNIERVDFNAPSAGTYTITVTHKGSLSGDGGPFAPPGDQDYALILTGNNLVLNVGDNDFASNVSLFPNPNKGEFTINLDNNPNNTDNTIVTIYDLKGREVYNQIFTNNSQKFSETIRLNKIQAGIYIANISQGSRSISRKLVIE